jgi:hypothetical protein
LKKIISSFTDKRPATEAASLALGVRPGDLFNAGSATPDQLASSPISSSNATKTPPWRMPDAMGDAEGPSILAAQGAREDKDSAVSAHKAAFFFKLERELEKVGISFRCLLRCIDLIAPADQYVLPQEGSRVQVATREASVTTSLCRYACSSG